jgi:glycosyltransferase involved in cell wall biosynthesis
MELAAGMARAGASVEIRVPWSPGRPLRAETREGVLIQPHLFATNALLALPGTVMPNVVALSLQPASLGPRRLLAHAHAFDVVQFELPGYARLMQALRGRTKVVYSAHNVEADLVKGQARVLPGAQYRRVRSVEARAVGASDLVVACTAADADRLRELYGGGRYTVVPNGFDASLAGSRKELRASARAELGLSDEEKALIFIGGGARHNRDAIAFVHDQVLPRLIGRARLLVVGKAGADLERDDRTLPLGWVEDLRGVLAAADVGLNPVEYGSGSNLKMAEYLAAGLPVVTTPVGARGFEGAGVRVASLEEFAGAIESVDPGDSSHRDDLDELRWDRLGERLLHDYEELLRE